MSTFHCYQPRKFGGYIFVFYLNRASLFNGENGKKKRNKKRFVEKRTHKNRKKRATAISLILIASCIFMSEEPQKAQRRWWIRPWLEEKDKSGLNMVNNEFKTDPVQFKKYLRMRRKTFKYLLEKIRPLIEKKDTNMREAIKAKDKLILTLRFLATGESYRSLMYQFRVSESTISLFVPVVCRAIYQALKDDYLKTPTTAAEWLNIAKNFNRIWQIPNTIGAIDGKHVVFRVSRSDGSHYYNYKGTHSIVLLALVDANSNFIYVDVGVNGRVSDGGVYRQSTLAQAIAQNKLNIPEDKCLPGRNYLVPHVILGDGAFPLSNNIIKPYPYRHLSEEERVFNYRLSRGRRVVENVFGILANRFRIFLTTINLNAEKVQDITLACCVLHNYLRASDPKPIVAKDIDWNYTFKYGLSQQTGNRSRRSCVAVREEFKQYFNNEGAVYWQYDRDG